MSNKIKIVFRQKTYEEVFCAERSHFGFPITCITPKELSSKCGNLISDDEITTTLCDESFVSLIREQHTVYIKELNEKVAIHEIIPQSDGSYVCYIHNKRIVTEETRDSLLREYSKLENEKEEEIRVLKDRLDERPYKHRWFNFRR